MSTSASLGRGGLRMTVAEGLSRLPTPEGKRFVKLFERGEVEVELYAPRGHDPQTPHARDEIYIIASGRGTFLCGEARTPFAPGDFLFVPAGVEHRFENFTDDFATWVIFFGAITDVD